MQITLRDTLDIQTTNEDYIVQNSSKLTIVTQLHYWAIDRKCASDMQASALTIVLNSFVGQFLT